MSVIDVLGEDGIFAKKLDGFKVRDVQLQLADKILHTIKSNGTLLAEAGTDKSNMISAMIWLSDIRTRHDFNPIWDAWVPEGSAPVRACVEARLAEPSDLVEIQVTAFK